MLYFLNLHLIIANEFEHLFLWSLVSFVFFFLYELVFIIFTHLFIGLPFLNDPWKLFINCHFLNYMYIKCILSACGFFFNFI